MPLAARIKLRTGRLHLSICLLFSMLCLAGCAIRKSVEVAESLGGFGNAGIVRQPDKIDACLLRSSVGGDRRVQYEETEFLTVPADLAEKMQAALLNNKTYAPGGMKLCAPRYFARLRFHQGQNIVAVDFCFDCMILAVHRDGRHASQRDFLSGVFFTSLSQLFPAPALTTKPILQRASPTRPNR